jgi:hypothetical protein
VFCIADWIGKESLNQLDRPRYKTRDDESAYSVRYIVRGQYLPAFEHEVISDP